MHIHTHTPPTHTPSTHTPMNHKHPFAIQSILVSSQPNHFRAHAAEHQSCQCLQRLSLSLSGTEESELQKAAEKLKRTFFIRRCIILTWGPGLLDCGLGSLICWIVEWGDKEERERGVGWGECRELEGKERKRDKSTLAKPLVYTSQLIFPWTYFKQSKENVSMWNMDDRWMGALGPPFTI